MTNVVPLSRAARGLVRKPSQNVSEGAPQSSSLSTGKTTSRKGASGQSHTLSSFPLIDCPDVEAGLFVLSGTDDTPVAIGGLTSLEPSENLATIRQGAAQLGASTVSVRAIADPHARLVTLWDLQAQAFGRVSAGTLINETGTSPQTMRNDAR
ncbi:MAG: hypothetical protein AAFZ01_04100 [Pseudomonadota bacterium]